MFELSSHGTDVYVGTGPRYPWGGLYGGQIVAQALRAATLSVDTDLEPHSIRAYFIRRGDHTEPVRYEVDRIRNGRSFATRRVVARQAVGAILNAESSFQRPESSASVHPVEMPSVPEPDDLEQTSWSDTFDKSMVPPDRVTGSVRDGNGRTTAWMRVREDLGDPDDPNHRPLRADRWHLYDFTCQHYVGGRGLSFGHVFRHDGTHVATIAQEVLVRDARSR